MIKATNWTGAAALAFALAACGGDSGETAAPAAEAPAEKVDALTPGKYEIVATVTTLDVTEGNAAATALKVDDVRTHRVCVGEDGKLPADAFGEAGDDCSIDAGAYIRRGKMREQLTCSRSGQRGQLNLQVDGEFTADTVEGVVRSGSFFAGTGDYNMTRSITGKRVGDCPA